MESPPSKICDPELFSLTEAIQKAKENSRNSRGFEHDMARFLQIQCLATPVPLNVIFRGLEVLGVLLEGVQDETRLTTLLRPFLRSPDPRIASKSVLVVGRQSNGMSWLKSVLSKTDDRVRANLIESLWNRKEPEAELILKHAAKDHNPRVAANAVYGLYLLEMPEWAEGFETLIRSGNPGFRRAGIWMLRKSMLPDGPARLKLLIRDGDPDVRKAAFEALIYLRENTAKTKEDAGSEPAFAAAS